MKSKSDVLNRADQTLATARLGLRDVLEGKPERRLGGLRNLIVFGRAVTNVLQGLRSIEPEFEAWYQPYVEEMRADPLLRYFYVVRSEVLKEGVLKTSHKFRISNFEFPKDMQRLGPLPAGAGAFFMGDQAGGTGWEVALPDGSVEKFYVDLPADIGSSEISMPDAPSIHLGVPIADSKIETLSQLYFDYLSQMVRAAHTRFEAR